MGAALAKVENRGRADGAAATAAATETGQVVSLEVVDDDEATAAAAAPARPDDAEVAAAGDHSRRGLKLALLSAAREAHDEGVVGEELLRRIERLGREASAEQRRVLATRLRLSLGGNEAMPRRCLDWSPWGLEGTMLLTVGWRLNAGQAYEALQLQLSRQRLPEWLGILDVEGDVDLQYAGLTGLPESVGELAVSGDLRLAHNALAALPDSFGEISVGGMLKLSHNRLERLPETLEGLRIGGTLRLDHNLIAELPEGFGRVRVGGGLHLSHNRIARLPASVGELEVPGTLGLQRNLLQELPPELGRATVGGDLRLDRNLLEALPGECSGMRVRGYVWLGGNRLAAAPPAEMLPRVVMGESRRGSVFEWRVVQLLGDGALAAGAPGWIWLLFCHDAELAPPWSGVRHNMLTEGVAMPQRTLLLATATVAVVYALAEALQRRFRMRPSNWRRYLTVPLTAVHVGLGAEVALALTQWPHSPAAGALYYAVALIVGLIHGVLVALGRAVALREPLDATAARG